MEVTLGKNITSLSRLIELKTILGEENLIDYMSGFTCNHSRIRLLWMLHFGVPA